MKALANMRNQPLSRKTSKSVQPNDRSIAGAYWMDPTSIFLSALRHADPEALARFADRLKPQTNAQSEITSVQVYADVVASAGIQPEIEAPTIEESEEPEEITPEPAPEIDLPEIEEKRDEFVSERAASHEFAPPQLDADLIESIVDEVSYVELRRVEVEHPDQSSEEEVVPVDASREEETDYQFGVSLETLEDQISKSYPRFEPIVIPSDPEPAKEEEIESPAGQVEPIEPDLEPVSIPEEDDTETTELEDVETIVSADSEGSTATLDSETEDPEPKTEEEESTDEEYVELDQAYESSNYVVADYDSEEPLILDLPDDVESIAEDHDSSDFNEQIIDLGAENTELASKIVDDVLAPEEGFFLRGVAVPAPFPRQKSPATAGGARPENKDATESQTAQPPAEETESTTSEDSGAATEETEAKADDQESDVAKEDSETSSAVQAEAESETGAPSEPEAPSVDESKFEPETETPLESDEERLPESQPVPEVEPVADGDAEPDGDTDFSPEGSESDAGPEKGFELVRATSGSGALALVYETAEGKEGDGGSIYEKLTGRKIELDPEKRGTYCSHVEKQIKRDFLSVSGPSLPGEHAEKRAQSAEVREIMRPDAPLLEQMVRVARHLDEAHRSPPMVAAALLGLFGIVMLSLNLVLSEGYFLEGCRKLNQKDYGGALTSLTESIKKIGFRGEAYFQRGRAYNKLKDYSRAIQDYTFALKFSGNHMDALDHRASLYMRTMQYNLAMADYLRLFKHQPNPGADKIYRYTNAGDCAVRLKAYEEGLKFYQGALSVSKNDRNAQLGQITCESNLKQYKAAIDHANALIEADPDFLDGYIARGWVNMRAGDDEAALFDFNYVLSKDPKHARAHLSLGHIFWQQKKYEKGLKEYELALASDPNLVEARAARAAALQNSKPDKALNDLSIVVKSRMYGGSAELWKTRGQLELRRGKHQLAKASFERGLIFAPEDTDLLIGAAESSFALQQYSRALKYIDKAINVNPFYPMAFAVRGTIHQRMDNPISAVSDLSQAIALDPRCFEAYLWRAQFYMEQKKWYNAQFDLNAALKLKPDAGNARKLLASVSARLPKSSNIDVAFARPAFSGPSKYASVPHDELVSKGYAELQKGNTARASEMLKEAVRQNSGDNTARRYLAHASLREDPRMALSQFEALISSGGTSEDEHGRAQALSLAVSNSLRMTMDIEESFRVLGKRPGDPNSCYKLAKLYASAGMIGRAKYYLQDGLSHCSTSAEQKRFQDMFSRLERRGPTPFNNAELGG